MVINCSNKLASQFCGSNVQLTQRVTEVKKKGGFVPVVRILLKLSFSTRGFFCLQHISVLGPIC